MTSNISIFRFIDFMKEWDANRRPRFMDVAYTTEKSIQDELERSSKAEMSTVIISYAVMFVYVTLALGKIKCSVKGYLVSFLPLALLSALRTTPTLFPLRLLNELCLSIFSPNYARTYIYILPVTSFQTNSKIILSIGGIIIVMASVACSLGVFGYAGVSTTLLTIEVSETIFQL